LVNDQFERIWKEAVVSQLRYCTGMYLQKTTRRAVRIADVEAEQ
jgi:hypothetical protein